jgi:hypothetical protein
LSFPLRQNKKTRRTRWQAGLGKGGEDRRCGGVGKCLFDFLVHGVASEEGVVFLLLNTLGDRLFVALGEIAGDGLSFFAGFGAFEYDDFLHGVLKIIEPVSKPARERGATTIFCVNFFARKTPVGQAGAAESVITCRSRPCPSLPQKKAHREMRPKNNKQKRQTKKCRLAQPR